MRVLLIGAGGVGEAIAMIARSKAWLEQIILADYNLSRAMEVQSKLNNPQRFPVEYVDARDQQQVEALARKYGVDLIMNSTDPRFNVPIFEAAYTYGCTYMDMAMTLSSPHPQYPYSLTGVKLGDYQFERASEWVKKDLLAVMGLGVEPGMSDVFARFARDHLFDQIDEIGVRDGSNLVVQGYDFAPTFSIWTTIEECLNPPVIWEKGRGWYTTQPFSEPEVFNFPEGIGSVECVNVEHEEVVLIPRWIDCGRVTFKYGLGNEFICVLDTLHKLGLDSKEPVKIGDVRLAPRDVVAAVLPDPAHLGDRMVGKTCAGTWIKGRKGNQPRQVYIYQVADNETCMRQFGCQAVVAQTAFNPVLGWELLNSGAWKGVGCLGPEAFDPVPFMEKMAEYGFPYGIQELTD